MSVTGPYNRESGSGLGYSYQRQIWYRQTRPRRLRLVYSKLSMRILKKYVDADGPNGNPNPNYMGAPTPAASQARAQANAYRQFNKGLGTNASLGVSLAERKQAVSMIAARASQLLQFTRALRRFEFRRASKILGLDKLGQGAQSVPKNLRKDSKAFANNYLEFHFGWSPLIKDIGDAVEVLQGPVPSTTVRGRAGDTANLAYPGFINNYYEVTTRCQLIAEVRIENPNLRLASQLGFVNPALVAWELVPYSFVVDWFANVGEFLGSFTDFAGLELVNPATTFCYLGKYTSTVPAFGWVGRGEYFALNRTQGISGPTLQFKPFRGFSVRRGLAAISLLLQQMR